MRGLDYYSEVVFEFHYLSNKGNNYGAIGAGGHYDKLVKEIGGPDLPGVGFSFGIERIVSVLADDDLLPENNGMHLDAYVMPIGEESQEYALNVANEIRMLGYSVDMCFDNVKLGNMFKRAEKKNAKLAIIVGEEEIKNNKVIVKNMQTQVQITIDLEEIGSKCDELLMQSCCEGEGCKCQKEGK